MLKITFVDPDGIENTMDVPEGKTVMQAALSSGISGIVGECGGSAMCATCHVYVDPQYAAMLPPISADEDAMLDATAAVRTDLSRLSCQLPLTAALDGLVVRLPETQL